MKDVHCECGNSMLNREKSTPNWTVYDVTCSACGSKSPKAAAEVRAIILGGLGKKKKAVA